MGLFQKVDPTKQVYCFRLSGYDCYAVRTGQCSLDLTDEQASIVSAREGNKFRDGSVGKCRELAESLINANYYTDQNKLSAMPMQASMGSCGHVSFIDGQHRACIAKRLGINETMMDLEDNDSGVCSACFASKGQKQRRTYLVNKVMALYKKHFGEPPHTFLDVDYLPPVTEKTGLHSPNKEGSLKSKSIK